MPSIKTLISRNKNPLLKPSINPNKFLKNHPIPKSFSNFFSTQLNNSHSYPKKPQKSTKDVNLPNKNKRPLDLVFKEALGLSEKEQTFGIFSGEMSENDESTKKLLDLELEIMELKAKLPSKDQNVGNWMENKGGKDDGVSVSNRMPKNLAALFGGEVNGGGNVGKKVVVFKEISKDMEMMLRHLYYNGYFKDVNFLPGNRFDMTCFYENYARDYVKRAFQKFGNDKMEIAKWLSGSDVKSIALVGCPSTNKGDVFAAKKLRSFFNISEETVCSKCVLKESCKNADKSVEKTVNTTLRLDALLRLLRSYSLEEISPRVKLTDDVKACVSRLIHEVINLTKGAEEVAVNGGSELASGQS